MSGMQHLPVWQTSNDGENWEQLYEEYFEPNNPNKETVEILMYFAQIRTEVTYEEARSGDIYRSVLDNGKAVQTLNWRPKTKLLPGLMTTFSYFLGRDEL